MWDFWLTECKRGSGEAKWRQGCVIVILPLSRYAVIALLHVADSARERVLGTQMRPPANDKCVLDDPLSARRTVSCDAKTGQTILSLRMAPREPAVWSYTVRRNSSLGQWRLANQACTLPPELPPEKCREISEIASTIPGLNSAGKARSGTQKSSNRR